MSPLWRDEVAIYVAPRKVAPHPDMPWTLDLRRHPGDHPMPEPMDEDEVEA